jgi:hypothetical protein
MALVAWIYGPTPPELRTFREYSPYLPCSSVRSNGSRDFANSLQRILTIRSSSENSSSCGPMSLCLPSTPSKVQILLNFPNSESFRKTLARTPCGRLSNTSKCWNPSTLRTPTTAVSQYFTQVHNPETSLSLRTPCTAPVPTALLWK